MKRLVKKNEPDAAWYPVSISRLDNLLGKVITSGYGYPHTYALRRNIAYNLQHIEFLDKCLSDLKLSSVLITQTWKSIITVGCGIIESLLYFLIVKKNLHPTDWWELEYIAFGNEKKIDDHRVKIDSCVYKKLETPKPKEMSFDAMLKKARKKGLLGSDDDLYVKLNKLRKLRNKVHLHAIDNPSDTDWNAFQKEDIKTMTEVLYEVFTSTIFRPSAEERGYFDYLKRYCET